MTLKERIRWYAGYWRPHRHFLVFLALFTLVSSAVTVAYPLAFKEIIDRLTAAFKEGGGATAQIGSILGILGLIAAGRFIAGFYPCFRAWMNQRLEKDIRDDYFGVILGKGHGFFNHFRTGDIVTRLTDDVSEHPKVAWWGCSGVFRAVESGSKLLFCVAVMFTLNWRLTLLAMIPLPVMLFFFYHLRSKLSKAFQDQQTAISHTNDILEATFTGVRIVKAFQAEKGQRERLGAILDKRIGVQFRATTLMFLIQLFDTMASRFGQAIVIAAGGYMVLRGTFTVGGLYAFYVYLDMLIHPMIDLPNLLVTAKLAFVCVDRLEEMRRHPSTDAPRAAGRAIERIEQIELQGVSAAYNGGEPVLDGVSFRIPRGSRVAVVGGVGSGKSSLIKILLGLLDAGKGTIAVNGRPLPEWDLASYRSRIGYVPQEALLFSETIRDNVTMGRAVREPDILEALTVAQMAREVADMPDKLDTVPGIKGHLVSGGQRQRIAIARALAGAPDLLLLDDCTASLDATLEDRFWSALFKAMPEVTCLIVSHRPATILRAERIVVLNKGRVVADGTHRELLGTCPEYQEFLKTAERKAQVAPIEEANGLAWKAQAI